MIPSTVRDATYVLDGILGNETELPLFEHTVDTHGFTETVFALFAGLGLRFSPRIKDVGDQILYGLAFGTGTVGGGASEAAANVLQGDLARSLLSKRIDEKLILRHTGTTYRGWWAPSSSAGSPPPCS